MDAFSYLSVLLSIIVGLAITQALQGVRALVLTRGSVRLYLPSLIWTGLVIVFAIQFWWASFGLANLPGWSFLGFTMVIAQSLCLYMLAALVLPDLADDRTIDLRAHYERQRPWFFGTLLAMLVASVLKDFVLNGALPGDVNLIFHATFGVLTLVALIVRANWFHQAQAPLVAAAIVTYIAMLFARL